jgi:hypothetical protein
MSAFDPKQTLAGAKFPSRITRLFHRSYAMTTFVFDLNQIQDDHAQTMVSEGLVSATPVT